MNEKNPIISVIVPIYNTEKYLAKCLDSLIHQTMKEIEIICINDGSPDKSLEILKEYMEKDERIKVIDQENTGVSGARNAGNHIAAGEYIMYVDSDDWIAKEMCEELYKVAQKEGADAVMCSYTKEFAKRSVVNHIFDKKYCVWESKSIREKFHRRLFGLVDSELQRPEEGDLIVSPCMQLFRYANIKDIEFVDLKKIGTFEDGLFQIQAYKNCGKFVYIDEPFYHYRKTNATSLTTVYNPNLYSRWQNLYNTMSDIIKENQYDRIYQRALNNRICIGLIGLGLNEISAKNKSIFEKSKTLKNILKTTRYEEAYKELPFEYLPFKWKVFFSLCKHQKTFLLVLLLYIIEFLRTR